MPENTTKSARRPSTPLEMIEAIRRAGALPGAEELQDTLLDAVRLIASATVAAADLKKKVESAGQEPRRG